MKKINFFLFMAIFMFIVTTLIIFIGISLQTPLISLNSLSITILAGLGYFTTACYYNIYLREKNDV